MMFSYKIDRHTDEILPVFVDEFNHCLAEGTKITTLRGDIPIEEVTTEDYALTRAGYKPVLWSGMTDKNRTVYTVTTHSGKRFEGTENHKVFTSRGWIRIDALRYNDEIIIVDKEKPCAKSKHSSMQGVRGTDTRNPKTGQPEFIGRQLSTGGEERSTSFTGKYGQIIAALSQKGITYITKTIIRSTMTFLILSVLKLLSTYQSILRSTTRNSEKTFLLDWKESDLLQKRGIHPQRAMLFTRDWLKTFRKKTDIKLSWCVLLARKFISLTTSQKAIQNSAQTFANHDIDGSLELMTSDQPALYVPVNSCITNTESPKLAVDHVLTVSEAYVAERVYDLTIKDQHEFFANGVLVHNCIDSVRYALELVMRRKNARWIKNI
jgi:hypothetical protein